MSSSWSHFKVIWLSSLTIWEFRCLLKRLLDCVLPWEPHYQRFLHWHGLTQIFAWISNHTPSKVSNELFISSQTWTAASLRFRNGKTALFTLDNGCNYFSMLGLSHAIKRGPRIHTTHWVFHRALLSLQNLYRSLVYHLGIYSRDRFSVKYHWLYTVIILWHRVQISCINVGIITR